MHFGFHHLEARKGADAYPHPDRRIRALDAVVYVFSIASPLIAVPQLVDVWVRHQVAGISLFYWLAQTVGALIWLAYGLVHKTKPIAITNALWLALNAIIAIGVLVYR